MGKGSLSYAATVILQAISSGYLYGFDIIDITGLVNFAPGEQLIMLAKHSDGTSSAIKLNHTYNEQQIEWFKAGSALNLIRRQIQKPAGQLL